MKLLDLIATFRRVADDDVEDPYHWDDDTVASFLAEGEREACIRARLLPDETTTAVCNVPLVAGQLRYQLSPLVDVVRTARLAGRPIGETSLHELDDTYPLWRTRTGRPQAWFLEGARTLVLDRTPTAAQAGLVINLSAFRLPLLPLSMDRPDAEPEIEERHHLGLVDWAMYRAYSDLNTETMDTPRAQEHLAAFVANFGQRPDANVRRKQRDRRPPVTRLNPGW